MNDGDVTNTRANIPRTRRDFRLGLDLGGSKIAGVILDPDGHIRAQHRIATPQNDYDKTCAAIAGLAGVLCQTAGVTSRNVTIGVGIPGSIAPKTHRIQNANSTVLNGRDLLGDLQALFHQPVRLANDANCFALSEATDGNAGNARTVFGVIAGTGLGGGIVINGQVVTGPRATGGEWGHNPLPSPGENERPGPICWCGRSGCLEAWLSGPGLSADYRRVSGSNASAEEIESAARAGEAGATLCLQRHADRFARGLAQVTNILDPDVIVLGGGLSKMQHLYHRLPELMRPHLFSTDTTVDIRPPKWGDASGTRGAAWLWKTDTLDAA
ncbi:MAG: ROK family protein [Pseudomonadota bacterium]